MRSKAQNLISSRAALISSLAPLARLGLAPPIGANNANFIVVPILDREGGQPDNVRSQRVYKALAEENGVVIRFRGNEAGCEGCVRITIGTEEENAALVKRIEEVLIQFS
jgi:histidinol-phosphate aminotransferase